jgi:hypothetical protein
MEKREKTFPLNLLFFLRFESSFSVYDGYTDVITRIKGVKPAAFICSHSCVFSFQTKNKKKISWRLSHHQMEGEVWPIDEGAPPHLIFHLARPERKKKKKLLKCFSTFFLLLLLLLTLCAVCMSHWRVWVGVHSMWGWVKCGSNNRPAAGEGEGRKWAAAIQHCSRRNIVKKEGRRNRS